MDVTTINQIIKKQRETLCDFNAKDISDGRHTFGELYHERSVLFSEVLNSNPEISFKSKKHFDEENDPMYNGCFIAGIKTPRGIVTFHIKLEYWDDFKVKELENAPKYEGHCDIDWIKSLHA